MNREYHKWFSPRLGRDMELLVFGHAGTPLVVFPTSMGRFYDFENRGMIEAIGAHIDSGSLQAFCVDSVDAESWYNKAVHPSRRVARHIEYEQYLINEVLPFIRIRRGEGRVAVTGCSFGGYHSVNFTLKHPDLVSKCVSLGGAFDMQSFVAGYWDENCYFNSPPAYLPSLNDDWFLSRLRSLTLVLATGEHDICLDENRRLSAILDSKGIPHQLDVWGDGTGHDWPWWKRMAQKFF